ncbi:MAG: ankyrin repeat domain-containing protein [Candidatus Babeliales bacterium]|nr:ankyrin repeat domain-containing protein [Candidatus Babeliales bacterium]
MKKYLINLLLIFIFIHNNCILTAEDTNFWNAFGKPLSLKKAIYFFDLQQIEIFLQNKKSQNAFIDLVFAINQNQHGKLPVNNFDAHEIAKLLLKYKVNINEQNYRGKTALFIACKMNNLSIINFLIQLGANLDITNDNGNTALIEATIDNNPKVFYLLLNHGADFKIANIEGKTFLDYTQDQHIILALFKHYKRQLNNKLFNNTPLIQDLINQINEYLY